MINFFTKLLTPIFIVLGLVSPNPEIPLEINQETVIEVISRDSTDQLSSIEDEVLKSESEELANKEKELARREKDLLKKQADFSANLKKSEEKASADAKKESIEKALQEAQQLLIEKQKKEGEIKALQEAQQILVEKQQEEEALIAKEKAKRDKLNSINLRIANLNKKYLEDIENCTEKLRGRGATKADLWACESPLEEKYDRDFNSLKVEYQQELYSS